MTVRYSATARMLLKEDRSGKYFPCSKRETCSNNSRMSSSSEKKNNYYEYSHERDIRVRSRNLRIVGVSEDPPYDDLEEALTYFFEVALKGNVFISEFQARRDVKQKMKPRHIILTVKDEQTRNEVLEEVQATLAGSRSKIFAVKDLTPQELQELRKQRKEQREQREAQGEEQREKKMAYYNNKKEKNLHRFASEEEESEWKALNLRIVGVPEYQDEDIYDVLYDFFSQHMHLAVDLNEDVERAWREGRHIVIRFSHADSRRRVLERRGDLLHTPYRITYDLTRAQQQKKQQEWRRRHSTQQES